jgi:hypothetical protein
MAGKINFFYGTPTHWKFGTLTLEDGFGGLRRLELVRRVGKIHFQKWSSYLPIGCHLLLENGFGGLTAGISKNSWKTYFFYETPTHWLSPS